jgi:hypothetical protein
MLIFRRLENQITLKYLGARKPKGLNRISKGGKKTKGSKQDIKRGQENQRV